MRQSTWNLILPLREAVKIQPLDSNEICRLLDEIASADDPQAVSSVLPLALERETDQPSGLSLFVKSLFPARQVEIQFTSQVKDKAVAVIALLMSSMPVEEVADFDMQFRSAYRDSWEIYARPQQTRGGIPISLPPLPEGPARVWALGAMASDGNGFMREAAVQELSQIDSGDELPFLLWRTTDWVQPVRELAATAVRERLNDTRYCLTFAKALPLVRRLEDVRRNDLSDLTAAIHRMLIEETEQASLTAILGSERAIVRRQACRVLNGVAPIPSVRVIEHVSHDQDVIVRQWAMRWEPTLRASAPLEASALRRRFLLDSSPRLRAEALRAGVAVSEVNAAANLWSSVSDSSGAVRLCARYHLRQMRDNIDFAAHYREVLQGSENVRAGAIAGLGEAGASTDFDVLLPYLDGPSRQAKTTLKSLFKLDAERARPVALRSLIDERPGMRRIASKLLSRQLFDCDSVFLMELWERRPKDKAASSLAATTLKLPPWTALDVLLSAVEIDPANIAVQEALEQWCPTTSELYPAAPPPEELRRRLREKLQSLTRQLSEALAERLALSIDNPLGNLPHSHVASRNK